jgi:hypothetical protein
MNKIALAVAVSVFATASAAQSSPDSELDCVEAAKLLLAELDKIDTKHGFTQRSLTQQLYEETTASAGGPYVCQAYRLMGAEADNNLGSIALEYYVEASEP